MARVKVRKENLTVGDGVQEDVIDVQMWNKNQAIDSAMKHLGMLDEQVDVRIDDQVIVRLQRGRAHNAEWHKKHEAQKKKGAAA